MEQSVNLSKDCIARRSDGRYVLVYIRSILRFYQVILVDDAARLAELAERLILEVVETETLGAADLEAPLSRCPLLRRCDSKNNNRKTVAVLLRTKSLAVLRVDDAHEVGHDSKDLETVGQRDSGCQ